MFLDPMMSPVCSSKARSLSTPLRELDVLRHLSSHRPGGSRSRLSTPLRELDVLRHNTYPYEPTARLVLSTPLRELDVLRRDQLKREHGLSDTFQLP